jgi:hypothetical protein
MRSLHIVARDPQIEQEHRDVLLNDERKTQNKQQTKNKQTTNKQQLTLACLMEVTKTMEASCSILAFAYHTHQCQCSRTVQTTVPDRDE